MTKKTEKGRNDKKTQKVEMTKKPKKILKKPEKGQNDKKAEKSRNHKKRLALGKILYKKRNSFNALIKIKQAIMLVGAMDIVRIETKTHQYSF